MKLDYKDCGIIGFTCSTFDLLHAGHITMLEEAKRHCDYLIVGLQTDPTIDRPEKNKPIQSLVEIGFSQNKLHVDEVAPSYFHPGKSGSIYLNKNENNPVAYFGEVHPNILKKIDIKTESLIFIEI